MMMMQGLVFGLGFAITAAIASWMLRGSRGLQLMAMLLVAAAAVYVGAALASTTISSVPQSAAFVVFTALAVAVANRPAGLGVAWIAHALWDTLHLTSTMHIALPQWYQFGCLIADLLLGAFLILSSKYWMRLTEA